LGDIFAERTERANGDEELLSVTIANGVIRQADSDKRNIASEDKSNYKIVRIGDVPYNSMRMWQGAVGNSEYDGIVSPAYTVLVPLGDSNGKFFMELFKKESSLKVFQRWSQGLTSDTWNLKYPVLSTIEFSIPSPDEQMKVAEYFQSLDQLITLHQRQKTISIENNQYVWEQRKLGELAVRESNCDISSVDMPCVEYEDVIANEGQLNKDISLKEVQKKGITFDGSQVLYGKLRPYLHNWLNPDFMGVAVGDWWVLRPVELDKNFLYRLIQTQQFDDVANQSAGSKMPRADWNLIAETEFIVPSIIKEQAKIGEYFTNLDNLITLHQCKCQIIRFKCLNDWEQRKLGDVAERVQGNDGRMDLPTLTISAANGWLDQRDRFSSNIAGSEQKNYTLLHKGELSYNHGNSKLAKYGTVFALRTYEEALVPRVYHSFKVTEEADADFIEYVFATKLPDRELGKLISSGARMDGLLNINYDEFMSINIMMPSVAEQIRISDHLRKVDRLITLHQRKCNELQNIKKYMLQNMFV